MKKAIIVINTNWVNDMLFDNLYQINHQSKIEIYFLMLI
jgi:hypothetical protein